MKKLKNTHSQKPLWKTLRKWKVHNRVLLCFLLWAFSSELADFGKNTAPGFAFFLAF
nr:MAG TPA: hypothetical protein [Caudoviricetes sp.]